MGLTQLLRESRQRAVGDSSSGSIIVTRKHLLSTYSPRPPVRLGWEAAELEWRRPSFPRCSAAEQRLAFEPGEVSLAPPKFGTALCTEPRQSASPQPTPMVHGATWPRSHRALEHGLGNPSTELPTAMPTALKGTQDATCVITALMECVSWK